MRHLEQSDEKRGREMQEERRREITKDLEREKWILSTGKMDTKWGEGGERRTSEGIGQ